MHLEVKTVMRAPLVTKDEVFEFAHGPRQFVMYMDAWMLTLNGLSLIYFCLSLVVRGCQSLPKKRLDQAASARKKTFKERRMKVTDNLNRPRIWVRRELGQVRGLLTQ